MSHVRPFEAADVAAVAALYKATLLHQRSAPTPPLIDYLRAFYLDGPFRQPDIHSLVHVDDGGAITGFVGVHVVPYLIGGRPVRAAFCGALMSRQQDRDPMVGARLLKAFLAGPQDLSMSETAIAVTQAMWTNLRGSVIGGHSLDWVRIFRPAGFSLALAERRLPAVQVLRPLARLADRAAAGRRRQPTLLRLAPVPAQGGLVTREVDLTTFAELIRRSSENSAAHPDWSHHYLEHVLETAREKPGYGDPVVSAVVTRGGEALGGFFYHLHPGGIGRVLQIAALPGRGGLILDRLFADAFERGAAGLRGRSQPWLLQAATSRQMIFAANAASVVHARDATLAEPFLTGDCLLNGLAGESWNRLFGGGLA